MRWKLRTARPVVLIVGLIAAVASPGAGQLRMSGNVTTSLFAEQAPRVLASTFEGIVSLDAQYRWASRSGSYFVTVEPIVRIDGVDAGRVRLDARTLMLERLWDAVELRIGVREVFWGAAESRHLVDVINQRDPDPRPGRDAKLGQPMVNLAVIGAWGTLDVFAMPLFRKRSFWGRDAYRNTTAPVAADRAKVEELPLDVAMRYGHTLGNWDVGMTYFYGRDRDPRFDQETDAGMPILVPLYDRVHRVGIDAQGVTGTWLWKVEAMIRLGGTDDYVAVVSGTEYSVREYLSAIAEIVVDSRGSRATTAVEHDAYLAARLLLHDASVEVGAHVDVVHGNTALSMTGEHRLGPSQTISLSARIHLGDRVNDPRFAPRLDNRLSLILRWFF